MVDIVSIIIAVVSLVGALLSASITGWFAYRSEERKRRFDSEKLVAKYRDPLLLAAHDLQSRLFNIVDQNFLRYHDDASRDHHDNVLHYTCFLVGQYFAWTHILRNQVQFLRFSTNKNNKDLANALSKIQDAFSTSRPARYSLPFLLWRGHQMAIGEIMTVKKDAEQFCVGYAAFKQQWTDNEVFRGWFRSIESDVVTLAGASGEKESSPVPDHRLRRLQHLLLDLIHILDPERLRLQGGASSRFCFAAPKCTCLMCSRPQDNRARQKSERHDQV